MIYQIKDQSKMVTQELDPNYIKPRLKMISNITEIHEAKQEDKYGETKATQRT